MGLSRKLKAFRQMRPGREFFPMKDGKLELIVTGKELYSPINSSLPSPDIIEYLYDAAGHSMPSEKLRVILDDEVDFDKARETYRSYFAMDIKKSMGMLRLNTLQALGLLLFGAAVLTVSYFLGDNSSRLIFDTVNIVGSFSVWEAADVFFLSRSEIRRQIATYIRLYEAEWQRRDIS